MPDAVLPIRASGASWRTLMKKSQGRWLRFLHDKHGKVAVLGVCLTLVLILILINARGRSIHKGVREFTTLTGNETNFGPPSLFIAIGSGPHNSELREAARSSWLQWRPSNLQVSYRFFSDAPPPRSELELDQDLKTTWLNLEKETRHRKDVILQPLPTGYGDKEHNAYAQRARYQMKWALQNEPQFDFFLRIDDDGFLCLHKLLYELKALPRNQFLWGRFWCKEGRNRADENFMLFSRDVVETMANDMLVGKIIPFDERVTLGWNIGYWSWVLNLTIFDDQERLDAQQGYLTDYMHHEQVAGQKKLGQFCEKYMYAHHVHASVMRAAGAATTTHLMYPLPVRRGPAETCPRAAQSFVPARHSTALPDLRIGRAANAPT